MIDPLAWIDDEAERRSGLGLTRRLGVRGRDLVNFGSNDYLGLAADPRLIEAARAASETHGWGAGASPLVSGWTDAHQALADAIARFERTEAALLFPTGYAANLGTVAALVGPGDALYADRLNHACLIDGARLSGARLRVYPHNDADRLASILERDRGRFRRSLIATDGVFSMDGDLAPLAELADIADRFGAMLLVDEAHGTGVFGPDGRGAASACGVADRVHVRVGTLSKAVGSVGGFVAGSRRLVDHLVNHARPLIYSTAMPPPVAAAALAALGIIEAEPWRRERVFALAERLRAGLRASHKTPPLAKGGLGGVLSRAAQADSGPPSIPPLQGGKPERLDALNLLDVIPSEGPIVAVVVGEPGAAVAASERLRGLGLFVPAIRPPTVPAGTSRLRVSLSAAHTDGDIDALIGGLNDAQGC